MHGLALRISLIMTAAIAIIVVIASTLFYIHRQRDPIEGFRLPLPQQMAAIVRSIETTPADRLPTLLTALNSSSLAVAVVETKPDEFGGLRLPALAWMVRQYLPELSGRSVEATMRFDGEPPRVEVRRDAAGIWTSRPIRLVIALKGGRFAMIEARGEFAGQIAGFRIAFFALIVSVLIGLLSLWALRRQLKPLQKLATAVERVGPGLDDPPLPPKGAREVKQLAAAIERMRDRIRALVGTRTRMTAAIGHDLRTYLTRLRLRAEFIPDPTQREKAVADIAAMEALTAGSLALARLDHDAEPVETVDLADLVRQHAEPFAADDRPVRVVATEPVRIRARPLALGRAVANLISNALTYGKQADVTVARQDEGAVILVEDRGPGIPEAEREAVFEPFYRRGPERNLDDPRFGLGLAIVAEIVAHHDGRITLEDREGGGLRVRVWLPAAG